MLAPTAAPFAARFILALLALAGLALATPAVAAPAARLEPGQNYIVLASPRPTESGNKVEVLEFFWYACPHCNSLQAPLHAWLAKKPADVEFRRVPAVLDSSWLQLARTYYAVEAMGLVDKLHQDIFRAIHLERTLDPRALNRDPNPLFDWVAKKGIDRKKFVDTYNSFAVNSRTQRAADVTRAYDIPHTPAMVVDGRYLTSPSMKGNGNPDGSVNYARFFQNLDELIAMARKAPRARKK